MSSQAHGGTAAAKRGVECECGHPTSLHEGDEYGFCLACECNHYIPKIRSVVVGVPAEEERCPRCDQAMTWVHCDGESEWVCNSAKGCGYNT